MRNVVIEKLFSQMEAKNTLACCGLDPDLSKFPREILDMKISPEEKNQPIS
jgi:hypothetical protein